MARDIAENAAYKASRCEGKKVEMLFAHLKRIQKLAACGLRGPHGARDEFLLAATAPNLRELAKLLVPRQPNVTFWKARIASLPYGVSVQNPNPLRLAPRQTFSTQLIR
jgi:hypothetical protein